MRKILLPLLFVAALVLTACGTKTASQTAPVATQAGGGSEPTSSAPTPTPAPFTDDQTPCKTYNILDQVLATPDPKLPPVTAEDWVKGPANAPITFLEYSDLQCPYCAQLEPILNDVLEAFPNDIRLVFRHWPLSFHPNAPLAAQAAEAAGKQGKFFDMLDTIFAGQSEWSEKSTTDFETWLKDKAATLGLDAAKFKQDMNDPLIVQKIKDSQIEGENIGLQGTPALYINGSLYQDQRSVEVLSMVVGLIKNRGLEYKQCPPTVTESNKDYSATLTTSKGEIAIDLFEKDAPVTVNNFVFLAQNGWFNNNIFLVVREDFVVSGDKTNTGLGGPGYAFKNEISPALKFDKEGVVGMYNFGPGTNGSQFFILKNAMDALTSHYTIFGKVTSGLDVLKALALHETNQSLESADKILSITITTK